MPVRKIPRNGRSLTGRVSPYNGGPSIGHESFLEHDFALLHLFDPDVIQVEEQPLTLCFRGPGRGQGTRLCRYTPDFLVRYRPGSARPTLLVEVKYQDQIRKQADIILPKIRAGQLYAKVHGWRFRVYTERHIRGCRNRLFNVKFLLPYRRWSRDAEMSSLLLERLAALAPISAEKLLAACGNPGTQVRARQIACLWRLLATHEVTADLDQPLTLATTLLLPCNRPLQIHP